MADRKNGEPDFGAAKRGRKLYEMNEISRKIGLDIKRGHRCAVGDICVVENVRRLEVLKAEMSTVVASG